MQDFIIAVLKLLVIGCGSISLALAIMVCLNLMIRVFFLIDDYLNRKENNFRAKYNIKYPCNNCTGDDYL